MSTVLVTGGSGFIGSHCIHQLLGAGHTVRTTVRNLNRKTDVLTLLTTAGVSREAIGRVSFFAADLENDAGWNEAVAGCEFVLHVASPFPMEVPKDENDLIRPARDGALRVLKAARDGGVKRVVLTSSFAAIGYGHPMQSKPFDETSWTNVDGPGVAPYIKSKTIAEKAAWDFIKREGGALELSVINPVAVFGPALGADTSTSVQIIKLMLDGAIPACPRVYFGAVDVRDVAYLHVQAMTHPGAKDERFLAVAGESLSVRDMSMILKRNLGEQAKRTPSLEIPDWIVRIMAIFDSRSKQIAPELGKIKSATNEKAKSVFGWTPRSNEECIAATAESLIRLGLLKKNVVKR